MLLARNHRNHRKTRASSRPQIAPQNLPQLFVGLPETPRGPASMDQVPKHLRPDHPRVFVRAPSLDPNTNCIPYTKQETIEQTPQESKGLITRAHRKTLRDQPNVPRPRLWEVRPGTRHPQSRGDVGAGLDHHGLQLHVGSYELWSKLLIYSLVALCKDPIRSLYNPLIGSFDHGSQVC